MSYRRKEKHRKKLRSCRKTEAGEEVCLSYDSRKAEMSHDEEVCLSYDSRKAEMSHDEEKEHEPNSFNINNKV
jgi:hypothetical protein